MYFLKYVFWLIFKPPRKATDCSFNMNIVFCKAVSKLGSEHLLMEGSFSGHT